MATPKINPTVAESALRSAVAGARRVLTEADVRRIVENELNHQRKTQS